MIEPTEWPQRIAVMAIVKQEVARNDAEGLWPYHFPSVAASEEQLALVERALGEALDPGYREFLRHAGGWRGLWHCVDLFGPDDLLGGQRFEVACQRADELEQAALDEAGLRHGELLPIAASQEDPNLFLIGRRSSSIPGTVVWFAGGEIDRFPSFEDYFLAMIDYNRLEARELARG